jgi:hypothetical protein
MTKTLVSEHRTELENMEAALNLAYWPVTVRNNSRREMDLPRLIVPMFGPVSSAYIADPDDPAGTAD